MSATLELHSVTKRYPGSTLPAVLSVTLHVPAGEILALVGESGSGKTTLLRLISGLERPDSGRVNIDGDCVADASRWTPPEKRHVGMVFQDGALFPHLTVSQNIRYGLRGIPKPLQNEKIESLLCLVGLDGFQKRYPHELSGGERQRLAVVRALAPEPRVILLDEPFSSLDPALRRSLRADMHRILKELNSTAILVTHDTEDALCVGDRIAVFRSGGLEQTGSPREVYHEPVNGYVARLFGIANRVGAHWVRPEDMELLPAFAPNCHPVAVREIRDAGKHREILVTPLEVEPEERWVLHMDAAPRVTPGMTGWVRLRDLPA